MRRLSHLFIALSAVSCVFVQADDSVVETIEVKGDFRSQPLNKIPGSIAVFTDAEIQRQNAQHLDDLLQQAANLNFSAGASRGRFLQVRGVGERSEFVDSINPSVGVLIDGMDYSVLGGSSLFDLEQVEVFRGPEATRFGANAMAGMLNLQSRRADFEPSGELAATIANYDSLQLSAAYGQGLTDRLAFRLAVDHQQSDGFINNTYLQRDDTNNIDETTAKLAFRYLATEQLTLDWVNHIRDLNNGYDAFSLDRNRTTLSDQPGQDQQRSKGSMLSADYTGLRVGRLHSQLSYISADTDYGFDEDWSYEGIHPDGYSTTDRYLRERSLWSAEQRLVSSGDHQWVAGWYHSQQRADLERQFWDWDVWAPAQFSSHFERKNSALFGELSLALASDLELTLGGRAERYQDQYSDSKGVTRQDDDWMFGGKASLSYQLSDRASLYGLVSQGYKAGGVNGEALGKADATGSAALADYLRERASFAPETLLNTEFGVKASNAEQTLVSRVALFAMWRDDMQVNSWVTRDQMFIGFIDNAASGRNYGLELESRYQARPDWTLYGTLGLLKSEIRGFVTEAGLDKTGRDQAHAPGYQYQLGSEWQLAADWSLNLAVQSKAAFYYSDSHDARSEQMHLLNLRLQYQLEQWQFALWCRNALDEDYGVRGFYFGNDPRDGYTEHSYEQLGEPRRIGLSARYQF
ncbi:TonB-dependent receptor [Rheinheimera sp.]|uniref:TonB-dependent receptor n=1 Tax=Rheinheimera sp. TaxID=1869214 RepID=UPI00307D67CB